MAKEEKKEEVAGIDADLQERLDGFIKELRPLLGKYELGIGAQANLTLDGRVEPKPIFVSTRGQAGANTAPEGEAEKPVEDTGGLSE